MPHEQLDVKTLSKEKVRELFRLFQDEFVLVGAPADAFDLKLFRGRGCPNCDGIGYKGRIVICEIVTISPALRDMIFRKEFLLAMREEAGNYGFQALRQDAVRKVLNGVTTLQEVTRILY